MTAWRALVIVDYGAGNIRSVQKAFEAVGVVAPISDDPAELRAADVIVLPGVGAFGDMMSALRARDLIAPIKEAAMGGKPLLGICVGLQVLFEVGEEMGTHEGLSIFPGRVRRFEISHKVPHIGWNQIHPRRGHPVLAGVREGDYAYFVHSYYPEPDDPDLVLTTTDYEVEFASVCGRGNVVGIQFHPEKSQDVGLRILRNFARWAGVHSEEGA
ncbi:MAG: imidazole glycerol phosphate synthase subunit HisH [Ardenticatenaceae bacterium]|nr:imidazole glycerol phosphate synthase subunit HisH [Ardenticatenaceae bacterium]HBY95063.1 imidazole glycerol phosphate synthase subunit HisH [Chloroflexota bacterium]